MKKRLYITASTFPRFQKDTEPRFILDIAKSLDRFYDVTVVAPAAPEAADEEVLEGIKVKRYHYCFIHRWETLCYPGAIVPRIREKKIRILLVPGLFFSLYRFMRKNRKEYDAVYANWLIPQGIVESFVRKPYIVTGHGGDVTSLNKGIMKRLKKRCIKKAAAITAVSKPLLNVMNDIYDNPCSEIISMGCDTKRFGREKHVDNLFGQNNKKVILFAGRLAEKKGVTYLIDALRYLEDVMLVIAGKGPLETELKHQAEDLLKELKEQAAADKKDIDKVPQIIFTGAKTHDELAVMYASADCFVCPSVTAKDGDKEGFGLVMLEAFASGLPVVASDSGGISDLVKDGINGLLVKEKDVKGLAKKIRKVLEDEKYKNELIDNAYDTVREYDYDRIGERYYELIEKAVFKN